MIEEKEWRLTAKECIEIVEELEKEHGIDLTLKTRLLPYVVKRAAIMSAIKNELPVSWTNIGKALNLNHATIIYHYNSHDANYKDIDIPFNQEYRKWYRVFATFIRDKYSKELKADHD